MTAKLPDLDILYENLRYYRTRLLRTEDDYERETLVFAVKATTEKIERVKNNE